MKESEQIKKTVEERYRDDASVLQIRLNSDYVLERIRIYLTGKIQMILYDEEGKPYEKEEILFEPKANNRGIQEILNYVQNIVNPQVVQGNFVFDQYQNYVYEIHGDLIEDIMNNLQAWGINEDDYNPIINKIMLLLQPFLTRLIDNKERESYSQTIKALESSNVQQSRGLFK